MIPLTRRADLAHPFAGVTPRWIAQLGRWFGLFGHHHFVSAWPWDCHQVSGWGARSPVPTSARATQFFLRCLVPVCPPLLEASASFSHRAFSSCFFFVMLLGVAGFVSSFLLSLSLFFSFSLSLYCSMTWPRRTLHC